MGALLDQQHHVGPAHRFSGLRAQRVLRVQDRLRHRMPFVAPARIFVFVARCGERVADHHGIVRNGFFTGNAPDQRQTPDQAGLCGQRGLRPEDRIRREAGIQRIDDCRRIASGLIGAQQRRALRRQMRAGGLEHARLGAAEAVNRLLGVADDEDAGLAVVVAIGIQPALHDVPLQRIGVLEFVQQDLLVTRIEPALQIGRVFFVRQQPVRLPFQIGEVEHAALGLDRLIAFQIGGPGGKQRGIDGKHLRLGTAALQLQQRCAQAGKFVLECRAAAFAEIVFDHLAQLPAAMVVAAHCAFVVAELGQQLGEIVQAGAGCQRAFDFVRALPIAFRRLSQQPGDIQQALVQRVVVPQFQPGVVLGVNAAQCAQPFQRQWFLLRVLTLRAGPPFGALVDECVQQFLSIKVADAVVQHQQRGFLLGITVVVERLQEGAVRLGQQFAAGVGQRVAVRHAGRQRRDLDQLGKPAVKGVDRQRLRAGQHAFIQIARGWQRLRRFLRRQAAFFQQRAHRSFRQQGQVAQQR